MTGWLDSVGEKDGARPKREAGRPDCRKSVFSGVTSRSVRGGLSLFGMAVGYLGLVAMLSTAPFWHQMVAPELFHLAACTDFGGSR